MSADFQRPIVLTGGGTGGHVYPAVAIAQAIQAEQPMARFAYIGVRGGIEQEIAAKHDIAFHSVWTAPFPGKNLRLLRWAVVMGLGTIMAAIHLIRLRPTIVIATGGYVSAPAVFAAVCLRPFLGLKIFVHEQNAAPGRLNRLVARWADTVGLSFHHTERYLPGAPVRYVGYPVRPSLRAAASSDDQSVPEVLRGIPEGRKIVLAFGGSQGARAVNRATVDALEYLQHRDDVFVLHGVGRKHRGGYDPAHDVATRLEGLKLDRPLDEFYRRVSYIDDIGSVYAASTLIVCRGGAGTVKEISAVGRPAILLPKAGLSGDHQVMNALVQQEAGAGVVLLEEPSVGPEGLLPAVRGDRLAEAIERLLDDPDTLAAMGRRAAEIDDPQAMARILAVLQSETAAPEPLVVPEVSHRIEIQLAERTPSGLLGYVRSWRAGHADDDPTEIPGRDYLVYRASTMVTASAWRVRNVGVKLIGLLKLAEAIPLLRHLFFDPTPASALARMLNGDRIQNGFIRRNICMALKDVGVVNEDVRAIVRVGLTDGYWEVRREACDAIRLLELGEHAGVEALLEDRLFEVRIAAIDAVGQSRTLDDGLPLLRRFYLDNNWKIRRAVLSSFERWAAGAEAEDLARLRVEFEQVLLTAGGYRPVFGLKETGRRVAMALPRPQAGDKAA